MLVMTILVGNNNSSLVIIITTTSSDSLESIGSQVSGHYTSSDSYENLEHTHREQQRTAGSIIHSLLHIAGAVV